MKFTSTRIVGRYFFRSSPYSSGTRSNTDYGAKLLMYSENQKRNHSNCVGRATDSCVLLEAIDISTLYK